MLYERLLNKLKDHKSEIERKLLASNVKDFNEYKYVTGRIQGVQDAIDKVKTAHLIAYDEEIN
jgi:hypothetical protein